MTIRTLSDSRGLASLVLRDGVGSVLLARLAKSVLLLGVVDLEKRKADTYERNVRMSW